MVAHHISISDSEFCRYSDYIENLSPTNPDSWFAAKRNIAFLYALTKWLSIFQLSTDFIGDEERFIYLQLFQQEFPDLEIKGIGKIIFLVADLQSGTFNISQTASLRRIAYVMVDIDPKLTYVELLGFIPTFHGIKLQQSQFSPSEFRPIEDLIDHANNLKRVNLGCQNYNYNQSLLSFHDLVNRYPELSKNPRSMVNSSPRNRTSPIITGGIVIELGRDIEPMGLNIKLDSSNLLSIELVSLCSSSRASPNPPSLPLGVEFSVVHDGKTPMFRDELIRSREEILDTNFYVSTGDRFSVFLTLNGESTAIQFEV